MNGIVLFHIVKQNFRDINHVVIYICTPQKHVVCAVVKMKILEGVKYLTVINVK